MSKNKFMICNICKQKVVARKSNEYQGFPVQHKRANHVDNCHGFFEQGFMVKGEKNGQ